MEGHVVGALFSVSQGHGDGVSVCDFLYPFSVVYRAVLPVYLLYAASKDDVVACGIFASGISQGDGLCPLVHPYALDPGCFSGVTAVTSG